jgi:hypothetical protein
VKKKIIAFSLWGNDPMFTVGVMKNIELAAKWYPGWICRIYLDASVKDKFVRKIIPIAEVKKMPYHHGCNGLFWRMLPIADLQVERFIVRDADSRLGEREAVAVQEWVDSKRDFHIMRDHPNHNWKIMGGMWSAMGGMFPRFKILQYRFFHDNMPFNSDQTFLAKELWHKIKNSHMAHDDMKRVTGRELPFKVPMKTIYDFIGNKYEADDRPVYSIHSR